jgi:hypothetical protein
VRPAGAAGWLLILLLLLLIMTLVMMSSLLSVGLALWGRRTHSVALSLGPIGGAAPRLLELAQGGPLVAHLSKAQAEASSNY